MKLYKYRSLDNLEFALDILLKERLHCAPFERLNDPLEGLFIWKVEFGGALGTSPLGRNALGILKSLKVTKTVADMNLFGSTRICSLSATLSDVRLWSHYANGHSGIAIEVELGEKYEGLYQVEYLDRLKEHDISLLTGPRAEEVLRIKTRHWEYEREYRIISGQDFVSVEGQVTGVYFGLRTSELLRVAILNSAPKNTPVYATKLNEKTVEIEVGEQLNLSKANDQM